MAVKTEITICLGSSCFARGNKKTLQTIQSYIDEHQLGDKVFLRCGHCFGLCEKGPILKINKTIFEKVDHLSGIDILTSELDNR